MSLIMNQNGDARSRAQINEVNILGLSVSKDYCKDECLSMTSNKTRREMDPVYI